MNIYENMINQRKIAEKLRRIPTKSPIVQLLIELQVKTWNKNDADTLPLYLVVIYANYLIFISSNVIENIRNKRKF